MKKLILLLALTTSASAFAESYEYHCVQKQWGMKMDINVTKNIMTILNEVEGNGSSKVGNLGFVNKGAMGGAGKMKDNLKFVWSEADSTIYNWSEINHYYVQPSLLTGGVQLRNGSLGGFVTYEGQGYSYESFVCFRK